MDLLDMILLLLIKLSVVQCFLLEVVDLPLQIFDLLVLLHLKLLVVYLGFKFAQLLHHELHVAAVSIQKVFFLVRENLLYNVVDASDLLVDHV